MLEAIVGIAIVGIVMSSVLTLLVSMLSNQKKSEVAGDYFVARNQVLNQLIDYRGWGNMTNASSNAFLACMVNLGSTTNNRDCSSHSGTLNLYNLKNDLVFNFSNAQLGFDLKGGLCTTYQAPPAQGDPSCPLRLDLQASPICAGVPCNNPPYRITGLFTYNGDSQMGVIKLSNMNFEIIKSNIWCPAQTLPVTVTNTTNTTVAFPPNQVISTQAGKVASTGEATTLTIYPCRLFQVQFQDGIPVGPLGGGLATTDAENRSAACLYDLTTSQCAYEYRRYNNLGVDTYDLYYRGVKVFSQPGWLTISSASQFQFSVSNGLVSFCVDGQCIQYFDEPMAAPMVVHFNPAGLSYSPAGFNNINFLSAEL